MTVEMWEDESDNNIYYGGICNKLRICVWTRRGWMRAGCLATGKMRH